MQFNEDTQEIEKLHHFFSQKPEFPTTSKPFEELMIQRISLNRRKLVSPTKLTMQLQPLVDQRKRV